MTRKYDRVKATRDDVLQHVLSQIKVYVPEHDEAYDNHYGLIR